MSVLERLFSNKILFKGYDELEERITNFDSSSKIQGVGEPGTDASLIYQATRKNRKECTQPSSQRGSGFTQ
jgi:hypothetical protein